MGSSFQEPPPSLAARPGNNARVQEDIRGCTLDSASNVEPKPAPRGTRKVVVPGQVLSSGLAAFRGAGWLAVGTEAAVSVCRSLLVTPWGGGAGRGAAFVLYGA
jgi:hypothetical protein